MKPKNKAAQALGRIMTPKKRASQKRNGMARRNSEISRIAEEMGCNRRKAARILSQRAEEAEQS